MPGRVESYEALLQVANIRLTVRTPVVTESGDLRNDDVAVLNAVPVIFSGGSKYRFIAPLEPGDTVLVVFTSRSLDKWLTTGGIVDPGFVHHHHVSDAVAIPILRDWKHLLENTPSDHASIGHDAGATIEFRQNEIRAGSDTGTQKTLMGETYRTAETSFFGALVPLVTALSSTFAALAVAAPAFTNPSGVAAFNAAIGALVGLTTALTAATTSFNSGAPTYLTSVFKVI